MAEPRLIKNVKISIFKLGIPIWKSNTYNLVQWKCYRKKANRKLLFPQIPLLHQPYLTPTPLLHHTTKTPTHLHPTCALGHHLHAPSFFYYEQMMEYHRCYTQHGGTALAHLFLFQMFTRWLSSYRKMALNWKSFPSNV
jgi:hypothetical protein